MKPVYYVLDAKSGTRIPVRFRSAGLEDFQRTRVSRWQSDWTSMYMRCRQTEKYALEMEPTGEVVALGAYKPREKDLVVEIEYIESAPNSNPVVVKTPEYFGIGAVMLAFGIQQSVDHGYGGAIFLKAKTSRLLGHYIQVYGAAPFSRIDPSRLLIEGDAAMRLLSRFLKGECKNEK